MATRQSNLPDLSTQLVAASGFALSKAEANEAARKLAGFIGLLAKIDSQKTDQGIEDGNNRSGREAGEAKKRPNRVRKHRAG